jgi:hypothetical protein
MAAPAHKQMVPSKRILRALRPRKETHTGAQEGRDMMNMIEERREGGAAVACSPTLRSCSHGHSVVWSTRLRGVERRNSSAMQWPLLSTLPIHVFMPIILSPPTSRVGNLEWKGDDANQLAITERCLSVDSTGRLRTVSLLTIITETAPLTPSRIP